MPPFFPAHAPNANAAAVSAVRDLPTFGGEGGVAVSAVVFVVSVPGCVGERETRVKHRDLVANVPPLRGWRPELGRRPRRLVSGPTTEPESPSSPRVQGLFADAARPQCCRGLHRPYPRI